MNRPAINRLLEAIHYLELGHDGQALLHIDEARSLLVPPRSRIPRPEEDPTRPGHDREAWRQARG